MLLRPRLAAPRRLLVQHQIHQQKRTFLPEAFSALSALSNYGKPLHFHANRTLHYPQASLFNIISDIASYPSFLPGLHDAQILARTTPRSPEIKSQPALASLTIGIGDAAKSWGLPSSSTSFVSRVYCSPTKGVVEAVAGEERGSLAFTREELSEAGYGDAGSGGEVKGMVDMGPELFRVCRTRWMLADAGKGRTEVDLRIEIEWKNALLASATQAAAPAMAERVIAAFEKRARDTLPWK